MSSRGGPWIAGKRPRRISRISFVSSTDSVVWVRYDRFSGSGTSTVRASSGLWTRIVRSGACPVVPDDLLVPGVADQDDRVAGGGEPPRLDVHLGDERAGRVDHLEAANPRVRVDVGRHAVRRQDDDRALRHLGLLLDEDRALGLQVADHVQVMDDLLAHVDGRTVLGDRPLDRVDRAVDTCAVAAGGREEDLPPLMSPMVAACPPSSIAHASRDQGSRSSCQILNVRSRVGRSTTDGRPFLPPALECASTFPGRLAYARVQGVLGRPDGCGR